VADTGCGIPDEEQSRVFERFYQVERARSGGARGTGLGLSIVRHAMSAMRGSVELHSKPGEGTTVTILIPAPPGSPIDSSNAHNAGT
jgi:signal transduction histidine kinase